MGVVRCCRKHATCQKCHGLGWVWVDNSVGEVEDLVTIPCDCQKGKEIASLINGGAQ